MGETTSEMNLDGTTPWAGSIYRAERTPIDAVRKQLDAVDNVARHRKPFVMSGAENPLLNVTVPHSTSSETLTRSMTTEVLKRLMLDSSKK